MSQIRNITNPLDENFPQAGVNNSSQGFRTNSAITKSALFRASDEITRLEDTQVVLGGDAVNTSWNLGAASGTINPTLNVQFSLASTLSAPVSYNSTTQDFILQWDAKGRLIGHQVVPYSVDWDANHSAGTISPLVGGPIGRGSGSIAFPVYSFNSQGRLTESQVQIVEYGLEDQSLDRGSLIVGGPGDLSTILPPPTAPGTFVLAATGNSLSWVAMPSGGSGGSTTVIGGEGISVTTVLDTATVDLDLGDLEVETTIANQDQLVFREETTGDPKRIAFDDLRDLIVDSLDPFELISDTSPQLGGNLDVQNFSITSSTAVSVQAPTVTLQAPSLTLNGLIFPTGAGLAGQVLSLGSGNQLVWSSGSSLQQTFTNTVFVGPGGNDTLGSGTLGSPYLTIGRALNAIPNNNPAIWTIMLLGGTYTENVNVLNKTNISIEGFFGSTNSIIRGNFQVQFNVSTFLMSKVTIDTSDQPASALQPTWSIISGVDRAVIKDCSFLRGPGPLSDLPAVTINGQLGGDVNFINTTIQGKIENSSISNGHRVVFQNCGLPEDGWTGLLVTTGSNTLISGAPLMKGVEHEGGRLEMENIGSIISENYSVNISNPDLPLWDGGRPKFLTNLGNDVFDDDVLAPGEEILEFLDDQGFNVFTLLLDPNGDPIPDPNNPGESLETPFVQFLVSQPDTVVNYNVGLFSTADADILPGGEDANHLELNNVNFYNSGQFSGIFKSGTSSWSFTRVKRRSDQDFITGPRLAYDVQPDEGNFIARYVASGLLLRFEDTNTNVPGSVIDPASGNTFNVTLAGSSTLRLLTPAATTYAPGPQPTSGEQFTEILVVVEQDNIGNRQVVFSTSGGGSITWLSGTGANIVPGGLTLYSFRFYSRTRVWIGQKLSDNQSLRIQPITNSTYTIQSTDVGTYIRRSSGGPNSVVVPTNASVPLSIGTVIPIIQIGSGVTSIVPEPGVIINSPVDRSRSIRAQFSTVQLTKVATNIWDLSGDLATGTSAIVVTSDNNLITADNNTVTADGNFN